MTDKKALHFGAGNIGRGFIGALLATAGYELIFADVVENLITALNTKHEYEIFILDLERKGEVDKISGVSGIISTNQEAMNKAISEASIITTAVGPNVLRIIARGIAGGIAARREVGVNVELNIIACENLTGASSLLKEEVIKHLKTDQDKEYLEKYVGFPNCAVDRIVPPFSKPDNPLAVGVENFYEWIVEEPAIKGPKPVIPGMKLTDNLTAFVQRKLFTLNCGHAVTAYLGFLKGFRTVDEALTDLWIDEVVRGAMIESGAALCRKHGFDEKEHQKYIEKIQKRFRNPYIKDDVVRVGREPIRKVTKGDRLVGPLTMAREFGLGYTHLAKGIAGAFLYENPEDKQSVELRAKVNELGIRDAVKEVTTLQDDEVLDEIVKSYAELEKVKTARL
jgi:mannitol-1-phosphate 5-dehydrogenase